MTRRLKSGEPVVDRGNSHLPKEVSAVLAEALAKIDSTQYAHDTNGKFDACVDMGREIGQKLLVQTTDEDEIVFAQRPKRSGLSRFVKNRPPEACTTAVIILKKRNDGGEGYFIVTGWVGILGQHEPWDKFAGPLARGFWSKHALVLGTTEVIPGTETTACPW